MSQSIGLFYGSSTCYTEIAAEKIAEHFTGYQLDIFNILDEPVATMEQYSYLILGIPTWDYGELQEDWEACWDDLDQLNLNGKTVALYGLGDQLGYPEWFQDALGYLWAKVVAQGAKTIGLWPVEGYSFTQSQALTEDQNYFVGLALDEDSQYELSDQRISEWCAQIQTEFNV